MNGFPFWTFEDTETKNKRAASDFENVAKESIQQADADLFGRNAGNILDGIRAQAQQSWESISAPVAQAASTVTSTASQAVESGAEAASAFGAWAGDRLNQARSGIPGYQQQPDDEPSPSVEPMSLDLGQTPPRDEPADILKPPALSEAFGMAKPTPADEPEAKAPSLADAFSSGLGNVSKSITSGLNQGAEAVGGAIARVPDALDAIGDVIKPGGGLASVANTLTGREEDERQFTRLNEIADFAREQGYSSPVDRRFERDYPELAEEEKDLRTKQAVSLGTQFSMGGAGRGVEILGDAARGAAPNLPAPIRRAGELLGGLRDTAAAMTRGLPGGAPVAGVVDDVGPAPDRSMPVGDPALAAEADRLDSGRRGGTGPGGIVPGPNLSPTAARLGQQAASGAVAGGYAASQEEDADLGSVARGAALGAVGGVARGALGRQGTGQAVARAVSYGPGTDAIDRSITPPPAPSPLSQAGKLPTEMVRQFFDNAVGLREIGEKYGPLKIGDDAYKLLRLARGSAAAANDRIETELGPALEGLGKQGLADLNRLLKSMDIVDKAAATGNPNRNFGGARLADANVAMQEMQTRLGPAEYAALDARAQQVWAFGDQLRDRLVQAGVWSPQTAADLKAKYPHYSPIKIADWLTDKAGGKRVGGADSISNSANLIKSLTEEGTARASETPLDAYVRLAHETERVATKNEAGRAFLGYLRQDPTLAALARPADQVSANALGGQIGPRKPGEEGFHIRENGQELTFWMDPALDHAFNFTGPALNHWLLKWVAQKPATVLRAGATTANILFTPLNAVGDAFTYAVRNGWNLPKSAAKLAAGYAGAITKDADYHAMMRAGGGQAGFWGGEVGAGKPKVEAMAGALSTPRAIWNWVSGVIPNVGQVSETGTRLAQFKRDISEGVDTQQAALNARDVTVDFQRFGELTKTLNSVIPFFNVGFQGPAQVARAFQNPDTRLKASVGLGAYVIAPAIAAEVYNQQDPTYADVPQYAKDRGLILMDPRGPGPVDPESGRPTPRYVTIASREWTPFVIAVRESVSRAMGKDTRLWHEAAQALFRSGSPIEPGNNAIFDLVPPAIKVPVEGIANYDSFRGRPIVPDSLKRLPPAEQYTGQTSETAKKLGGLLGASPLQIEHAVTGFGAGVGRQILGAGDLALKATGQVKAPSRRIAELEQQLAKSGLALEKRAILEHELTAEQSKESARGSLVRATPLLGGLASTVYREQGGELTNRAGQKTDERLTAHREGRAPLSEELKRLGINMSDVQPEIGGRRMNRSQEQQYREQALSLRERLLGELVTRPLYVQADDATKTKLVQDAMKRASGWAGQAVLPGAGREGAEFATTRVGKDPARAVAGYLKAVELDQDLQELRENRFVGFSGEAAEALIKDRGQLAGYISSFGPDRGKVLARRQMGSSRYYRALRARERPGYERQSERIRRDEDYQLFVGSAPDIIARRGLTTEDLDAAM